MLSAAREIVLNLNQIIASPTALYIYLTFHGNLREQKHIHKLSLAILNTIRPTYSPPQFTRYLPYITLNRLTCKDGL